MHLFVHFVHYVMTINHISVFLFFSSGERSGIRCRSSSRDLCWFQDGCWTLPGGDAAVHCCPAGWRSGNVDQKTSRVRSLQCYCVKTACCTPISRSINNICWFLVHNVSFSSLKVANFSSGSKT